MLRPLPSPTRGPAVLLLQPYDDGLAMYAEFLRYHGLAVVAVSDPSAALIAAPKADAIVTGILLAGSMDGVEFIARLRRDERTVRTPIIVLTACAWKTERERAAHAGCDLFLSKPCLPDELLRHVHQALATVTLRWSGETPIKAGVENESHEGIRLAADSASLGRHVDPLIGPLPRGGAAFSRGTGIPG